MKVLLYKNRRRNVGTGRPSVEETPTVICIKTGDKSVSEQNRRLDLNRVSHKVATIKAKRNDCKD